MSQRHSTDMSRLQTWFALLGGAIAWLAHLVGAYVIAEFGCVGNLRQHSTLGLTAVAWLILAVSAFTFLVSVASAVVGWRGERRAQSGRDEETDDVQRATAEVARTGWITSGLFAVVILVESLPIFFYLQDC